MRCPVSLLTKYAFEIAISKINKADQSKASLVQREVAFSQENDGGIVKKAKFLVKNNPSVALRQLPLHKGAFIFVKFATSIFQNEVCQ